MQKTNWKKCKLKDLVKINSSSVSKKDNLEHIVYLDTGNITMGKIEELAEFAYSEAPSRAKRKVKENSIVYSMVRPNQRHYGLIKNPTTNLIVSTGFAVLDAKEFADSKYIYYWLTQNHITDLLQSIAENSTSAYPAIRPVDLENLDISLPPLDEQKRIAEILGSLDDKIELLQKQNKTLEDMAKALFKSWFVDFDVVRAKQKGLPKADIMREYHLTEELYDLFPSSFADSPLGPIPSGWEVKKAQEIADIAIGRTPPRKETKWFSTDSTDTTWISIKDLGNCGVFIGDSSEYLTEDAVSKFKIPMIPTKTVVLSFKLTVGRVAITMKEMCSNEAIAQFKDAMVPVEYLYLLLKHINFSLLGSTSSIATAINSNTIKNMNVLIADSVLLSAFKERTQNLFDKIEINLKQIQTLTELRDTLLPRLISGKIRV
ncbi:restriction endonuclease subunit S [Candidatus Avelusimicrobium faecicola]|uniref:restriction endonuclease subunit S n=1 Tax=Candidatus Avelusimicrobium faecicola TaxID=3416205 RepID=UPI003D0D0BAE